MPDGTCQRSSPHRDDPASPSPDSAHENGDGVAVELQNLSKSYAGKPALRATDLVVAPQRRLALIGPSGCGKSTLLRLVIGLLDPDSGEVRIGGERMTAKTRRSLRLRMGYVIQEGGLFPHLTAEENAAIVARDLRWEGDRIRSRLRELAELTHLSPELLDRYPSQLSGGQRQRVGLMRALMLDPDVLLLDEPLGALDPMIRSRLQTDLEELFGQLRKTVLLVTHDMAEAAFLGEEIAVMRDGVILQRGRVADLRERPADPFIPTFLQAQRRAEAWDGGSA